MEIEQNNTSTRHETIRHWSDKEMKEMHHANGYTWRSNRKKLRVISVNDKYREEYDKIFGDKKKKNKE